jgi:RecB family exonuclease
MRFSPSSLAQYKLCPRRWAYRKLAKLPEKEKKGTSLGTEVHRALELYGKRESLAGISPEAIRCAQPGLKLIQREHEQGLDSEEEYAFDFDFEGNTYNGKIDRLVLDTGRTLVRDWKTLRSLSYALTEDELLDDEQGVIYAHAAYELGAERVTDQWVYLCTQKPEMRIVQVEQPKDRVVRRLTVINEQANEMKKLASELAPGEFSANIGACHSYGQLCSYHMANGGPCNPFGEVEICSMTSLADRIKAKKLTPEMLGMEEKPSEPLQTLVPDVSTSEPASAVNLIPPTTVVSQPKLSPAKVLDIVNTAVEEGVLSKEQAQNIVEPEGAQVLDSKGAVLAEVKETKKRGRPAGTATEAAKTDLQSLVTLAVTTLKNAELGKVLITADGFSVSVEK